MQWDKIIYGQQANFYIFNAIFLLLEGTSLKTIYYEESSMHFIIYGQSAAAG